MFYGTNIRAALFTGFLTLGGFLLSLKTFIIIKMKESVYDDVRYLDQFEKKKKLNKNLRLYGPLQGLSNLLFWAVMSAIVTALLQFSVGLITHYVAVYACIFMAAFTATLLLIALLEIKNNLNSWFELLNGDDKN